MNTCNFLMYMQRRVTQLLAIVHFTLHTNGTHLDCKHKTNFSSGLSHHVSIYPAAHSILWGNAIQLRPKTFLNKIEKACTKWETIDLIWFLSTDVHFFWFFRGSGQNRPKPPENLFWDLLLLMSHRKFRKTDILGRSWISLYNTTDATKIHARFHHLIQGQTFRNVYPCTVFMWMCVCVCCYLLEGVSSVFKLSWKIFANV